MHQIFVALFPLLSLILGGYLLKQSQFLAQGFWAGAEKLNYYFLFPAMLFLNLAQAQIDVATLNSLLGVLLLLFAIACAALYLIRAVYQTKAARFGVYLQSVLRFNTYIGLALVAALFQHAGLTILSLCLALSIPLVNVLSVLAFADREHMNLSRLGKNLITNPLILACAVGALYNLSGLKLWIGWHDFLKLLAMCSLPLGLLCVGAALQFSQLKVARWPLFLNTVARLLLMPALAWAVCVYAELPQLMTQVLVIFFALPTASAAYILTKVMDGDSELMAAVISVQTLAAALTLPWVLYWIM